MAVGLKMTLTVHVLAEAICAPLVQLLVPSRKSPLTVGVLEIVTVDVVPFVSVTGIGELCVPTSWRPVKVREAGLTLTIGFEPVPERVMTTVPPLVP